MTVTDSLVDRPWTLRDRLAALLLGVGLGLAGVGSYFHLDIAAQVRAGRCDGCEPWHPLIVLTPLVLGVSCVLLGSYLLAR